MFTSKFAWLAAAVIATSVAGSTVTAFAAGGLTNGSSAAQTTANQAQTATAVAAFFGLKEMLIQQTEINRQIVSQLQKLLERKP